MSKLPFYGAGRKNSPAKFVSNHYDRFSQKILSPLFRAEQIFVIGKHIFLLLLRIQIFDNFPGNGKSKSVLLICLKKTAVAGQFISGLVPIIQHGAAA